MIELAYRHVEVALLRPRTRGRAPNAATQSTETEAADGGARPERGERAGRTGTTDGVLASTTAAMSAGATATGAAAATGACSVATQVAHDRVLRK